MQELQEKHGSSFIDVQFMEEAMNQLSEVILYFPLFSLSLCVFYPKNISITLVSPDVKMDLCLGLL
jgi:hypothetical protein